jgi:hypothetical protein
LAGKLEGRAGLVAAVSLMAPSVADEAHGSMAASAAECGYRRSAAA